MEHQNSITILFLLIALLSIGTFILSMKVYYLNAEIKQLKTKEKLLIEIIEVAENAGAFKKNKIKN